MRAAPVEHLAKLQSVDKENVGPNVYYTFLQKYIVMVEMCWRYLIRDTGRRPFCIFPT